jgi:hypothetical protein
VRPFPSRSSATRCRLGAPTGARRRSIRPSDRRTGPSCPVDPRGSPKRDRRVESAGSAAGAPPPFAQASRSCGGPRLGGESRWSRWAVCPPQTRPSRRSSPSPTMTSGSSGSQSSTSPSQQGIRSHPVGWSLRARISSGHSYPASVSAGMRPSSSFHQASSTRSCGSCHLGLCPPARGSCPAAGRRAIRASAAGGRSGAGRE